MLARISTYYLAIAVAMLFFSNSPMAQSPSAPITTIDYVRAKPGELPRLLRFYELNWLSARRTVLQQGGISGFKLMQQLDSAGSWHIALQTDYPDSASYARREETFAPVLAAKGKILVDGLDRPALGDIVESVVLRVRAFDH